MYKGSCLCGSIQFELKGGVEDPIYCHCSLCRKASGSAFATNGFIKALDLVLSDAKSSLTYYEASQGKCKYFCSNCGTPIYSANAADPDRLRIRLGVFDTEIEERPISHNFITSKANWEDLDADLPVYDKHEPTRS
ncbi:hypothetical protein MED121_13090 [Marinomonas sp. MED121]|uniref:GFA family protein n=1 Tax=Marinomonas sp. MED121 TaxID=314277 RepID=UPI0000690026|nr:GFA family protein [Marinomonas sp. MED121]EAQ66864.1 hypothetical protein MED121_13090 [Marinomonas sp. MED121]